MTWDRLEVKDWHSISADSTKKGVSTRVCLSQPARECIATLRATQQYSKIYIFGSEGKVTRPWSGSVAHANSDDRQIVRRRPELVAALLELRGKVRGYSL